MGEEHLQRCMVCAECMKMCCLGGKNSVVKRLEIKFMGIPLPKLETIFPICVKGCRIIRDAEFLEDIR